LSNFLLNKSKQDRNGSNGLKINKTKQQCVFLDLKVLLKPFAVEKVNILVEMPKKRNFLEQLDNFKQACCLKKKVKSIKFD
jgi:hypothetical protein